MVSHGQTSDPFWSVVANGAGDAAREMGVRLEYQAPTSFDMVRMSQLIDAAVASRPSALAISVPDPDALAASVKAAVAPASRRSPSTPATRPGSGSGFLGHIGQTEYEAGLAAGERLAAGGAKAGALRESRGRQRVARHPLPGPRGTASPSAARRCRCSA